MKRYLILLSLIVYFQWGFTQNNNLEYYIQHALQNSPLLKDYQNQARLNRLDSLRLQAATGIQVNFISNSFYAPVINSWGYDEVITDVANLNAVLSVSREIRGKHNMDNQYTTIGLENQSLSITGKITEQELKKSITEQYIITYGDWEQYQYYLELSQLLGKEEQLIKKLAELGIYKQTDYLSLLVNLHEQELALNRSGIRYRNDFALLNILCGINDTSLVSLTIPDLTIMVPQELHHSLLYQQFTIDSLKLRTTDEQIDFSYRPKMNVYADAGYFSSLAYRPLRNFGSSIGVGISVPIYDGNQRNMQHEKIAISELTRQHYRDFHSSQNRQQIEALMKQLTATEQLTEQTMAQVTYTQTLMEANRKLMETGDTRIADYIIAIGSYLTAKNMVVQNTIAKYLIINQINYMNQLK
jgi:outer membrane protein TolC